MSKRQRASRATRGGARELNERKKGDAKGLLCFRMMIVMRRMTFVIIIIETRNAWQSLACSPRDIAADVLWRISETKLSSDHPRKLSTDFRDV